MSVTHSSGAPISSRQSTLNSTEAAIAALGTFTGEWERTTDEDMFHMCACDQDATLTFQFSGDGVTVDSTFPSPAFQVKSGIPHVRSAVKAPRYVRVVLTNTSGSEMNPRLFVYFGKFRQLNSPISQAISIDSDATLVRSVDTMLDISARRFNGFAPEDKFGRAPSGVQTTATDIWDRADATPTQSVWIAPTQARVHTIVSTDNADSDSGGVNPQGAGARTVRIWGLTDWDSKESSEDITLDGTNGVATGNSYVIIHRMRVLTSGTSGPNVGTITATAAVDGTVTAAIRATEGSTLMAIYGIPSVQNAYLLHWYASVNKAQGAAASIDFRLRVNNEPDVQAADFVTRQERGVQSTGNNSPDWPLLPYLEVEGPAIIKIDGIGSTDDIDGSAGFGLILVDQ